MNSEVIKIPFNPAWERIKTLTGWSRYGELATFLKIKQSSVSGAKKRGFIALEWVFNVAQSYNGSTDWLATGEGDMKRGEAVYPLAEAHKATDEAGEPGEGIAQAPRHYGAQKSAVDINIADYTPIKRAAVSYIDAMTDVEAAEVMKYLIPQPKRELSTDEKRLQSLTPEEKQELRGILEARIKAIEDESANGLVGLKPTGT